MERYEKWSPVAEIPTVLYCEELVDGPEKGLALLLAPEEDEDHRRLRLSFGLVKAYRNIDEGSRLGMWSILRRSEHRGRWPLFIVRDSDWIRWFRTESREMHGADLTHYMVLTPDDCVDVIADDPPACAWVEGLR